MISTTRTHHWRVVFLVEGGTIRLVTKFVPRRPARLSRPIRQRCFTFPNTPVSPPYELNLTHSGILNQEAQCVASDGVHVLNRENVEGLSTWSVQLTLASWLMVRFHYHVSDHGSSKQALAIRPLSATSARGKLVAWRSRVLAILYEGHDLVIIEPESGTEVGRVPAAGGISCQEVLYDVS
jgi:hypothetical protein